MMEREKTIYSTNTFVHTDTHTPTHTQGIVFAHMHALLQRAALSSSSITCQIRPHAMFVTMKPPPAGRQIKLLRRKIKKQHFPGYPRVAKDMQRVSNSSLARRSDAKLPNKIKKSINEVSISFGSSQMLMFFFADFVH